MFLQKILPEVRFSTNIAFVWPIKIEKIRKKLNAIMARILSNWGNNLISVSGLIEDYEIFKEFFIDEMLI